MACRFPGATDLESFWDLLEAGLETVGTYPGERFPDLDRLYAAGEGTIASARGGFLERLEMFDAEFFGISPREAVYIDPQHRLLLETAWEALEDAGQVRERLAGSATGVYVGQWASDYEDRLARSALERGLYAITGVGRFSASGRVSYAFDLRGPSFTVDTACSSSLVAVHLACQSLWNRQCDLALAAGANAILNPDVSEMFRRASLLSPDGRCKFADASADGFVRSEGAGVVVLKPLSRAIADGDPVYAMILGSAVNNDGQGSGQFVAPSVEGQETMLREALRDAGVSPEQVQYVEAHGTGTHVGDPVEIQAIARVLAEGERRLPCRIGSVKTNIGHSESAAGVAGLIKVALSLRRGRVPASVFRGELNPGVPWDRVPVVLHTETAPWPDSSRPAVAGVNSFGITGTNAHVIVQEPPSRVAEGRVTPSPERPFVLPLSAHSPGALRDLARAHLARLQAAPEPPERLRDLAYTAAVRRTHHPYRLALVASDRPSLVDGLEAFLRDEGRPGMSTGRAESGRRKLAFVFAGQGSQWVGMGRQLLEREPVFRETLESCDRAIARHTGWSLLDQLTGRGRVPFEDVVQPALFSMSLGLAALWRSLGVEPEGVVGHSLGETAAAHIAGALDLDDAAAAVCLRSRLVSRLRGQGGMALVGLPRHEVEAMLVPYGQRLTLAGANGPEATVISGDLDALAEMIATCDSRGVFCRRVKSEVAYHSAHLDPVCPEFFEGLASIRPRPTSMPFYSTVPGAETGQPRFDPEYWVRNLRQPVLLVGAVERMIADGFDTFLEVSPHPVLTPSVEDTLRHAGCAGTVLPSVRRERDEQVEMLGSLGALYTSGYPVDWARLYPGGECVSLPHYPWQRERFWVELDAGEPGVAGLTGRTSLPRAGGHPLLGAHVESSVHQDTHFWVEDLGLGTAPYVGDHRVRGSAAFPAVAYLEIARAAAEQLFGSGAHSVENVQLSKALFLPEDGGTPVQLAVSPGAPGSFTFQFKSQRQGGVDAASWVSHATGTVRLAQHEGEDTPPEARTLDAIRSRCDRSLAAGSHYEACERRGLDYGPAFQALEEVWLGQGEVLGRVRLPEELSGEAAVYPVHPVLLDACFQLAVHGLPGDGPSSRADDTYLPVSVERTRLHRRVSPGAELWGHVVLRQRPAGDVRTVVADAFLLDGDGRAVVEVLGLCLQRVERDRKQAADDCLYEVKWVPEASPRGESSPRRAHSTWIVFSDRRGVGATLASSVLGHGEGCVTVHPGPEYRRVEQDRYELRPDRPEDYRRLLGDVAGSSGLPCGAVLHLWSLDDVAGDEPAQGASRWTGCRSVTHLAQAMEGAPWSEPPRLWLVTSGVYAIGDDPGPVSFAQAPVTGLGRVVAREHPELRCSTVDLGSSLGEADVEALGRALWADDPEEQIAFRGGSRYVPRLARWSASGAGAVESASVEAAGGDGPAPPYRVEVSEPGLLDSVGPRVLAPAGAGPGEVEIEVVAAGLNFIDVLKAMGVYPGLDPADGVALGGECAGRVVAVGAGVESFRPGDEVVAVTPSFRKVSMLASVVTAPAAFVAPKPPHLTFEEAATVPLVFLTAHYALHELARLGEGERVLIHAASGGVGLAAVQLARRAGARVIATAGSPEKRELLASLGIEHVFNSRSTDFARQVMECTHGRGVDVVLNSLSGEFLTQSLATLAPYGRFLEIGKRDIYEDRSVGLKAFRQNISYFAIDLADMAEARPAYTASLFRDVVGRFAERALDPLPVRRFPVSEVADAFRHMAQAKHVGKVAVSIAGEPVGALAASEAAPLFRPDATYLVTGGLGSLGLLTARWMVENGARHFALVGRRGPTDEAAEAIRELEAEGARVVTLSADVADARQVAELLETIGRTMPPLRGVLHAAAVLDPVLLRDLTGERFEAVMAPKALGAWNLHAQTAGLPLDWFVLFSSLASLDVVPGHASYSAANAFLDALARHRRGRGLPVTCVNWGVWSGSGLVAAEGLQRSIQEYTDRGIEEMSPAQALDAFGQLARHRATEAIAVPIRWKKLSEFYAERGVPSLFSLLAGGSAAQAAAAAPRQGIRDAMLAVEPGPHRRSLLEAHLQEEFARVLKLDPSRIDPEKPMGQMGLDSLMALEFVRRLGASVGVVLSSTEVFNYPTITALAAQVARKLEIPLEADTEAAPAPAAERPGAHAVIEEVSQLSEDDAIQALLARETPAQ
jgi:acyl transferase domain-containing protein/NAD(P)-dependent dehydrogenase (short-subunit alcohol dehydrogenase family)/acyl carrier protein